MQFFFTRISQSKNELLILEASPYGFGAALSPTLRVLKSFLFTFTSDPHYKKFFIAFVSQILTSTGKKIAPIHRKKHFHLDSKLHECRILSWKNINPPYKPQFISYHYFKKSMFQNILIPEFKGGRLHCQVLIVLFAAIQKKRMPTQIFIVVFLYQHFN